MKAIATAAVFLPLFLFADSFTNDAKAQVIGYPTEAECLLGGQQVNAITFASLDELQLSAPLWYKPDGSSTCVYVPETIEEIVVTARPVPGRTWVYVPPRYGSEAPDPVDQYLPVITPTQPNTEPQATYHVGICSRLLNTSYTQVTWKGVDLDVPPAVQTEIRTSLTQHHDVVWIRHPEGGVPDPEAAGLHPKNVKHAIVAAMYPQGYSITLTTHEHVSAGVPGPVVELVAPTGGWVPGKILYVDKGPDPGSCTNRPVTKSDYETVNQNVAAAKVAPPQFNLREKNCQHWAYEMCWI